jgi:hypothetical protein
MSKTSVEATKEKPRQPRFSDGKFFHDVPLFDLDYLKPSRAPTTTTKSK